MRLICDRLDFRMTNIHLSIEVLFVSERKNKNTKAKITVMK